MKNKQRSDVGRQEATYVSKEQVEEAVKANFGLDDYRQRVLAGAVVLTIARQNYNINVDLVLDLCEIDHALLELKNPKNPLYLEVKCKLVANYLRINFNRKINLS